jgi:NADH:ubiquinone oxidoreductase subunit 6 (subunit J)
MADSMHAVTDASAVREPARPEPQYAPEPRSDHMPPMEYRDMPEPLPLRKILGPGVILAGLGVGSGEYILWPFITSNAGLGILWAALVGVTLQYFLNMEIERYTLATGETAVCGFMRFWKPWGILFCIFTVVPNVWPGWGTAGATTFSYLVGGDPTVYSILLLIAIGVALTTSPVVYQTLEKAEFFKVSLTIVFLAIAIVTAISASAWTDLSHVATDFGTLPTGDIAVATLLAGLVFAGAGGANNLVQSNWIRDKGYGMGQYIPRIVSPVTGEEEAAPTTGTMMRQDPENIRRFNGWFRQASKEQLVSFWAICIGSILVFSVLAYSTIYGKQLSSSADFNFIRGEGNVLKDIVGSWFGTFFWAFGTLSLSLVALGVVDYVSRLTADVLKTTYARENQRWSESKIYALLVWSLVGIGTAILLAGLDQPLVLLVLSACLNGAVMVVYSAMLIVLNRKGLPRAVGVRGWRLGILGICVLFYGFFVSWLIVVQLGELF